MATLKEVDSHAYQYFKDLMRLTLFSDLDVKKRLALEKMLVGLESAEVRQKCRCGAKGCLTYEFVASSEYELIVHLVAGAAENRYHLALGMANGDLVCLEAHTIRQGRAFI